MAEGRAGSPKSSPQKIWHFCSFTLAPSSLPRHYVNFQNIAFVSMCSLLCKLYIPTLKLFWDVELGLVFVVEVTRRLIFVCHIFLLSISEPLSILFVSLCYHMNVSYHVIVWYLNYWSTPCIGLSLVRCNVGVFYSRLLHSKMFIMISC